jgi:hypothetical protein
VVAVEPVVSEQVQVFLLPLEPHTQLLLVAAALAVLQMKHRELMDQIPYFQALPLLAVVAAA